MSVSISIKEVNFNRLINFLMILLKRKIRPELLRYSRQTLRLA